MIVHQYELELDRWVFRDGERVIAIWDGHAFSTGGSKAVRALFEELEHFAEQDEERCGAPWIVPILIQGVVWNEDEAAPTPRVHTIHCELVLGHDGHHVGRTLTRERVAFPAHERRGERFNQGGDHGNATEARRA